MKNSLVALLLLVFINTGFSQNSNYYFGRLTLLVKKEKLPEANRISDISDELWHYLRIAYEDRIELEKQRKKEFAAGYYLSPLEGYDLVVNYASIDISVTSNGKVITAQSPDDRLTSEQKSIINSADLGTDINIKVKFTYKNKEKANSGETEMEGTLAVAVVPDSEAEFPGGFNQLTKYLMDNIVHKISDEKVEEKLQNAVVKFKINEEGQVVDTEIFRTSSDQKIDKLILDAMHNMPKWKPAVDSKGTKVNQEFSIPFGGNGC